MTFINVTYRGKTCFCMQAQTSFGIVISDMVVKHVALPRKASVKIISFKPFKSDKGKKIK